MKGMLRLPVVGCVLFSVTFLASARPASAQAYVEPTPNILTDENGVDLAYGTIHYKLQHVLPSIDPELDPYARYWMGSGWRDSITMTLSARGTLYTVSLGGFSESFATADGGNTFTQSKNIGSTLTREPATGYYLYTDREGTIYRFDPTGFGGSLAAHGVIARATLVSFASGGEITLTYQKNVYCTGSCLYTTQARLQNVSSSNGFSYKLQYASDVEGVSTLQPWLRLTKITRYNKAVDYCDPVADSCAFSTAWPSITYGQSSSFNQWTETETDSAGNMARLVRLTKHALISTRRASSATDNMTVTWNSDVVGQVARDGRTWTYNFSQACCGSTIMTTTVTRPSGGQVVVVSDRRYSIPISVRDELGNLTAFTFDTAQNLTRRVHPLGNSVEYGYDSRGNATSATFVSSTPGTPASTTLSKVFPGTCANRVTCNRPISEIDARGSATDYVYDPVHGGVLTETLPAPMPGGVRPQVRNQYLQFQGYFNDGSGLVVASGRPRYLAVSTSRCQTLASCAGTADEVKTMVDHGPQTVGVPNNLLPVGATVAAGDNSLTASSTTTYDSNGWQATVDGPLPGSADTIRQRYDVAGRLTGTVGPDPDGVGALRHRAVRMTYDADGQPILVETGTVLDQSDAAWSAFSSLQQRAVTYDGAARRAKETLAAAGTTFAVTQYGYDSAGRPECTAVRMNPATFATLPSSACTPVTAGSYGPDRITKRIYDLAGRLTQLRSAVGMPDEAADEARTYTDNGQLATLTDAENNRTSYSYDGLDRQVVAYFPVPTKGAGASSATDYEQLTYDSGGNVVSRRLRDGTSIGFTVDALNRVTLKDLPGAEPDVSNAYDNFGRITGINQAGHSLGYTYDALGRERTQTGLQGTVTSTWDIAGRRIRITHPDGFYVDQDYQVTGELTRIRENGATSGVGVLAVYAYDDLGRLASLSRGDGSVVAYGYDGASRLASLSDDLIGSTHDQTLGFNYNPAGQITQQTRSNDIFAWTDHYNFNRGYTSNGLNQYTTSGSVTPTYDPRANLTSAGATTYAYNSQNFLVSASGGITFAYDPSGRLYQAASGFGTTRFAYDGTDLTGEYNASNVLLRRYVHGPSVDDPLVWYEGSGTTDRRFLHSDEGGSIVAVTSSAGAVIAVNAYDEYGVPRGTPAGRFLYTGQTWLPELGMYYYKARIYSPTWGRFAQTDPTGYDDGMNLYAYAGLDPINASDPTGLLCRFRDKDGNCIVKTRERATEEEKETARELARRINNRDRAVRELPNDAKIPVVDKNGNQIGEISGADYKWLWNHIGVRVVRNGTNFGNGGAGGSASFIERIIKVTPDAVAKYARSAVSRGATREDGLDTLLFHELSHTTKPGRAFASQHRSHKQPWHNADWTREARSSTVGKALLDTVGGNYVCAVTRCQ